MYLCQKCLSERALELDRRLQ